MRCSMHALGLFGSFPEHSGRITGRVSSDKATYADTTSGETHSRRSAFDISLKARKAAF